MAKRKIEDMAVDRSRAYEKKRRESEKQFEKRLRNEESYSRTLEIAMNLFNYLQDTPGMSRALLAEKLHVSQAYLCNLINGKLNPSIKTIEKYEKILSIKLLPVSEKSARCDIVSSLPVSEVISTGFFRNDSDDLIYDRYADRLQILSY